MRFNEENSVQDSIIGMEELIQFQEARVLVTLIFASGIHIQISPSNIAYRTEVLARFLHPEDVVRLGVLMKLETDLLMQRTQAQSHQSQEQIRLS